MLLGKARKPSASSLASSSQCTASPAQNYGPTARTDRQYPAWHPAARPWPQPASRSGTRTPPHPRPAARARSAAASLPAEQLLERVVSPEQAEADLAAIRNMWELAAVYEFLSTFKYWLNFTQLYPLHDLEEAIVKSPGPGVCHAAHTQPPERLLPVCLSSSSSLMRPRPTRTCGSSTTQHAPSPAPYASAHTGTLAQLHVDLLRGIATRSQVGQNNFASTLSARLISEAHAMQLPLSRLPFRPVRGREARDYAKLGAVDRCVRGLWVGHHQRLLKDRRQTPTCLLCYSV